jgi:predicted regulator of Ras-like GTPase activity (Roadblock/LC7/MglB family)
MSLPTHLSAPGSAPAGRASRLDLALAALLSQTPELLAASVVSFDGLPMASSLPVGMDEDRLAAMSAALLSLGERAAQGLGRGELQQVYVEGENGSVFLVSAQDEAVLVAVSTKEAKIGLMLFEVRRAAESVGQILRHEDLEAASEAAAHDLGTAVHVPAPQTITPEPPATAQLVAEPVVPTETYGYQDSSLGSASWT